MLLSKYFYEQLYVQSFLFHNIGLNICYVGSSHVSFFSVCIVNSILYHFQNTFETKELHLVTDTGILPAMQCASSRIWLECLGTFQKPMQSAL